ncbi:MAG TPA: thrombospondin type 3 repeat-containing protein [Polyangiaceae bacterium]|nr:thrombospondin type 3 repeat-containing protein [Polyangiaceae bacterium]
MQRMRRAPMVTKALGLVAACLLTASRPAAASIEYPTLVESQWNAKKLPVTGADGCPLCHTTDPGRLGTANQKFALTLKGFGLTSNDDRALKSALDRAKANATDSDGDGFSDYEEIAIDSTNPNNAKEHAASMTDPPPSTGASGSGPGPLPSSDAGGNTDAGQEVPDDGVSSSGSAGTDQGEPLPPCTTTIEKVYPPLTHGCSLGGHRGGPAPTLLAGVFAAYLIRRGVRAGKGRRELRGNRS